MLGTTWLALVVALIVAVGVGYFGHRWKSEPRRQWLVVWVIAGLIAVAYSWVAVWRHLHFETHAYDLGIFDQAIWNMSRFHLPASSVLGVTNLFGGHFSPILILLAPLYWIFNSPLVLLIAQAVLLSLIVPVLFGLGRTFKVPFWPMIVIAAVAALNPGVFMAINFDFHELAFAPVLFLGAAWAAEKKRWILYWLAIAGLILTKEPLCLYAGLLGLAIALRGLPHGIKSLAVRHGTITLLIGLVAFFGITRVIIPALNGGQKYQYWSQYETYGTTPVRLAWNIVAHPAHTFDGLVDNKIKRTTMRYMLSTFDGLPLLSPVTWPLTLLTFGERFWANNVGYWILQFHYQIAMVAVFALGTLYVLADARRFRWWRGATFGVALVMIFTNIWVYKKTEPWGVFKNPAVTHRPAENWAAALKTIPADAKVAAQDAFVPHLSHRITIYHFPEIKNADWIVLDPAAPSWPLWSTEVKTWQDIFSVTAGWTLVRQSGTLMIFKRQPGAVNPVRK